METYSTVLFVDQAPVGYMVHKGPNRIELNPAENPARTVPSPYLVAENRGGEWKVNGTENPDLIRQVIEEITFVQTPIAPTTLSAAP